MQAISQFFSGIYQRGSEFLFGSTTTASSVKPTQSRTEKTSRRSEKFGSYEVGSISSRRKRYIAERREPEVPQPEPDSNLPLLKRRKVSPQLSDVQSTSCQPDDNSAISSSDSEDNSLSIESPHVSTPRSVPSLKHVPIRKRVAPKVVYPAERGAQPEEIKPKKRKLAGTKKTLAPKKHKVITITDNSSSSDCSIYTISSSDSENFSSSTPYSNIFKSDLKVPEVARLLAQKRSCDVKIKGPISTVMNAQDLDGLDPKEMTTDIVITMAMELFQERQRISAMPLNCHFANALIYKFYIFENKNITTKIDSTNLQRMFFPVHLDVLLEDQLHPHWLLLMVDKVNKRIFHLDSLNEGFGKAQAGILKRWLPRNTIDPTCNFSEFTLERLDPPLQGTNDCAIAVIWCVDRLARKMSLTTSGKSGEMIYRTFRKTIHDTFLHYCKIEEESRNTTTSLKDSGMDSGEPIEV